MVSAHTETIEELLQSAKFRRADLKLALARLASEVKTRLTRGSSSSYDFFAATVRTLEKIKGTADAELRMSCLFDCCSFFYIGGYSGAALATAKCLDEMARRSHNSEWLRKGYTIAGVVYADAGNVAEAIILYSKALTLARELGDLPGELKVLTNLGVALNYAGLYTEAIPCLKHCVDLSRRERALQAWHATALANLAQSYLYLENYDLGFDAIQLSLRDSPVPVDSIGALNRTIREFTYVQLALELGERKLAREHSAICSRYAAWGTQNRSEVLADIARGLCEIHDGVVNDGLAILEAALAKSGAGAARIDALIALVKAYDEAGRSDLALRHLNDLIQDIQTNRKKSVLTLLSLSDEGLFGNSARFGDLHTLEMRQARLRVRIAEEQVIAARLEMLERLAVTADLKEDISGEHGYRVGKLASLMGKELGWSPKQWQTLEVAARLHDIGKIGIPDKILFTSKELLEAERDCMSTHTILGAELLAKSNIPQCRVAEEIARYHHEWWNGEGYPSRLAGKRIPIHARIVSIADVFDALTHGRPYSSAWPVDKALTEIERRRGIQFDPDLTDLFLGMVERLRMDHDNLDVYLGKAGRDSAFAHARRNIRRMLAADREGPEPTVDDSETRH